MLDELGLADALHNLDPVDGLARTVTVPASMPVLPAAVEVAIYRIAAEALHNVARHAGATRCAVELTVSQDEVALTITDNGRGLPDNYLVGWAITPCESAAPNWAARSPSARPPAAASRSPPPFR